MEGGVTFKKRRRIYPDRYPYRGRYPHHAHVGQPARHLLEELRDVGQLRVEPAPGPRCRGAGWRLIPEL